MDRHRLFVECRPISVKVIFFVRLIVAVIQSGYDVRTLNLTENRIYIYGQGLRDQPMENQAWHAV